MANEPSSSECASCGFSASATGRQIQKVRSANESIQQKNSDDEQNFASTVLLFFPEAIVAALVLVLSPFWLYRLVSHGKLVDAAFFSIAVIACGAMLYWAGRERSKGMAYAAVILLVVAGGAVFSA
jgi:Zn ribbon nucleic-acid-binding protein